MALGDEAPSPDTRRRRGDPPPAKRGPRQEYRVEAGGQVQVQLAVYHDVRPGVAGPQGQAQGAGGRAQGALGSHSDGREGREEAQAGYAV